MTAHIIIVNTFVVITDFTVHFDISLASNGTRGGGLRSRFLSTSVVSTDSAASVAARGDTDSSRMSIVRTGRGGGHYWACILCYLK